MSGIGDLLAKKVHDLELRLAEIEARMHDEPTQCSYAYVTVLFVMRGCKSKSEAEGQLARLLPQNPDETTQFLESWAIADCSGPVTGVKLG